MLDLKNKVLLSLFFIVLIATSTVVGISLGFYCGGQDGYLKALKDVSEVAGVDFEWVNLGNGLYEVRVWKQDTYTLSKTVKADSYVEHYRDGMLLSSERHAGVLTNIGKDYVEDQLSDSPSASLIAKYISVDDTDASGLSVASTQLTSELAASGLTRAAGTYASTGVGAWTVAKAFSVTGTVSAQTYGLQWDTAGDNNLLCYDTSSVKNCISGDTLTVTWTLSIS